MEIRIKGDVEDITDIYLLIRHFNPRAPVKIRLMFFGNNGGDTINEPHDTAGKEAIEHGNRIQAWPSD